MPYTGWWTESERHNHGTKRSAMPNTSKIIGITDTRDCSWIILIAQDLTSVPASRDDPCYETYYPFVRRDMVRTSGRIMRIAWLEEMVVFLPNKGYSCAAASTDHVSPDEGIKWRTFLVQRPVTRWGLADVASMLGTQVRGCCLVR
jgi:hypothetical protein